MMKNGLYSFMCWFIGAISYMMEFVGFLGLIIFLVAWIDTRLEELIDA